jgi:hypothetical protein
MRCLRNIMGIKWQQKILDTKVLSRDGMESIFTILKRAQLK